MASTEIGIDVINTQIQHCEDIVTNIDNVVPKLYKIRQQAIAQRNYISDINNTILSNAFGFGTNKSITLNNEINFSSDVNSVIITNSSNITTTNEISRKLIHSLFKFKHDVGTSKHFTTDQIGVVDDRVKGFNLVDVKLFTNELNSLLTASATSEGSNGNKLYLPERTINYTTTLTSTSNLNTELAPRTVGGTFIGFGLT